MVRDIARLRSWASGANKRSSVGMRSHFRITTWPSRSVLAWTLLLAVPVALSIPFLAEPFDRVSIAGVMPGWIARVMPAPNDVA